MANQKQPAGKQKQMYPDTSPQASKKAPAKPGKAANQAQVKKVVAKGS